jgi:hypothetical protein
MGGSTCGFIGCECPEFRLALLALAAPSTETTPAPAAPTTTGTEHPSPPFAVEPVADTATEEAAGAPGRGAGLHLSSKELTMARYGAWPSGRAAMDHEERSALGKHAAKQKGCTANYPSVSQPWLCTRKAEHVGDHVAGGERVIMARWPRAVQTIKVEDG